MDIAGKLTSLVTLVGSTYVTYSVLRDRFQQYIFDLDNLQTIHDTNENMPSQTTQDNTSHALSHLATTIFYLFYNHMFTLLLFMIMATVFVLFIAIVMFKLYKRIILHRDEETQQNSRHTPPASFNNNVNVTLWLKDVEKYFESHSINNNAHKLRYLLEHLDECNRNLVKTKIKTDRLETYDEASTERHGRAWQDTARNDTAREARKLACTDVRTYAAASSYMHARMHICVGL